MGQYLCKTKLGDSDVLELRVGSDSDFPRIAELLEKLNKEKIKYVLTINSAHRTPQAMIDSAKAFPNIKIPDGVDKNTEEVRNKIRICLAAAGGSAHIAGMTASETSVPVIALPVESSTCGLIDSMFSMINMPPGIPNGFISNQEVAAKMIKKIMNLELPKGFSNIQIPEELKEDIDKDLLNELGLTIGKSPIGIETQNIEKNNNFESNSEIPIIIPVITEKSNLRNIVKMENINKEGFYMGLTFKEDIRIKNAIIYAAKIIGIFNPEVRKKVEDFSKNLTNEVLIKNQELFSKQF